MPSWDPTLGVYLGPYGGPKGGGFSYEPGTPVREMPARGREATSIPTIGNLLPIISQFTRGDNPGEQ